MFKKEKYKPPQEKKFDAYDGTATLERVREEVKHRARTLEETTEAKRAEMLGEFKKQKQEDAKLDARKKGKRRKSDFKSKLPTNVEKLFDGKEIDDGQEERKAKSERASKATIKAPDA